MTFYWWDDAVALAHELARDTRIKHRVFVDHCGAWVVEPDMKIVEVCS